MNRDLPFFPLDLFEADRKVLLDLLREIGRAPEQKFILGEHTAAFEELLRESLGASDVVACGNGTAALGLVLRAMDVGPGDEVVVPAFGCAPLASSVVSVGAMPVFADVDPRTMVADPDAVEPLINHRTKAIMPAHMFSVMADMPRFAELADKWGVRLLEDSAVAQGAVLDGVPAGLWGDAGVFSFVQVKSFGMPGEGGAVVTRDAELGRRVRLLRNHGQRERFVYAEIGTNSRFDEIQAAFQLHRHAGFADRLRRRAEIAEHYTERFAALADRGVVAPPPGRNGRCYYVYCLQADDRDGLREHLAARGIGSHVYYPLPLPRQVAFAPYAAAEQSWPNAERASARILALPIHPHLSDTDVARVADAVREFAAHQEIAES
ncbi:DegT/DnrJ/EryC1/StrS family aminotransferase [Saccharopolyspora sp. HNM0986]|uniref:DegT/DnrJ/EryC1/StrS family aminotransferase n=1 Tax=Saccharopolyspora galaxeae TaxID=2781241 RepID=UPI00190A75B4|nr:DegT/DnrJ/EryC1/StrS family aminotransferase [Saccharopolyspora sp. HNM0986]MBK0869248.1 DegT/DnrJ/EryC1/StrS family aminotransferase [Saccharopolyspora sp. HNM0986]